MYLDRDNSGARPRNAGEHLPLPDTHQPHLSCSHPDKLLLLLSLLLSLPLTLPLTNTLRHMNQPHLSYQINSYSYFHLLSLLLSLPLTLPLTNTLRNMIQHHLSFSHPDKLLLLLLLTFTSSFTTSYIATERYFKKHDPTPSLS